MHIYNAKIFKQLRCSNYPEKDIPVGLTVTILFVTPVYYIQNWQFNPMFKNRYFLFVINLLQSISSIYYIL